MVRPPQPTHRGGAGTLCVYVVSLFAYTIKMIYLPCVHMYIHTYKQTINQYKQKVLIHKSIQTYSYTYTWLQMVRPPQPTHRGGAGTLCVYVVSLFAYTIKMIYLPCVHMYIHTYKQTINQYKQKVLIHKSIQTYSYTYTWLQMVRPPQPTHRGGAGTLCVHVVSLCADTKTMTCRPCLDTYIHTYKQTINQYKQIVIIHKSIETYSYTYTWLQMVRPPQPTHRGGGAGTLCVHVVSLCADTKTMTCRPCWDTHILTYQQTDRQTHRHTYINQYKHIVIPIHGCICVTYPPFGGGVGGNQGGLDHLYIYHHISNQVCGMWQVPGIRVCCFKFPKPGKCSKCYFSFMKVCVLVGTFALVFQAWDIHMTNQVFNQIG